MKKKSFLYYDHEIDLINLFRIISNGKIKIFLITIISFLIGFGYSSQIPENYSNSLIIKKSDNNEFKKIEFIKSLIELDKKDKKNESLNQIILIKFINELKDYDEYFLSLKNLKNVEEHIATLPSELQKKKLSNFKRLIKFEINSDFILSLKWKNTDEAANILKDTINFAILNLEKSIYKELEEDLKQKEAQRINEDLIRIKYLEEQSWIAKELNISDNQITQITNFVNGYFLLGYKAIDKEIEMIKNRDYAEIRSITKQINSIKKEDIKWVDYDINAINVTLLKNTKLNLITSVLLGLVIGTIYVLVAHSIKSLKNNLKKFK